MVLTPFHSRLAVLLAGLISAGGLCTEAGAAGPLGTFRFPDTAAARDTWEARDGAPAVRAVPGGTRFDCPFSASTERFYWDAPLRTSLRNATRLVLDITPLDPEACRTFSLYFKSGDGWYHWSRPIRGTARQQVTLLQSDFGVEGSPAGWDRITGLRISPWKARPGRAGFIVHGLATAADEILVVQASSSTRNAGEQAVSRQAARRISGFLDAMAIPHGSTDDDGVIAGALNQVRLAILSYNPAPPPAELRALRAFVDRGGALIVCYSASEELAKIMGLRLGRFVSSNQPGRWASIAFSDPSGGSLPPRVHDIAWNLIPVTPARSDARVIAQWLDASGAPTGDAACVASASGYWFSHVIRGEDPDAKARMFLGLVGRHLPGVWQAAARHQLRNAGRLAGDASLAETVARVEREAPARARKQIASDLDRARALHRTLAAAYAGARYPEVIDLATRLDETVVRAYARTRTADGPALRAVWDHDGVGLYPGDWPRTCRELAGAGFNAVFPNLLWAGKAHYPSDQVPRSKTFELYGDQVDQCVRAARDVDMQVHVWMVCWNLENAPADWVARLRREGRLQQSGDGAGKKWLCPSHPENRRMQLDAIRELATRYPIDGVHLDYIRFPSSSYCFCPTSRKAFESSLGYPVRNWPQAVRAGGTLEQRFTRWRAEEITRFVADAKSTLNQARPGARLSAAVFRSYPSCRDSIGQDWGAWIRQGLVDFVCPMTYTDDLSNFRAETADHLRLPGAGGRIVPGIGALTSESQLTPDQVLDQIRVCRESGAGGYVVFDLSPTLRDRLFPILRLASP